MRALSKFTLNPFRCVSSSSSSCLVCANRILFFCNLDLDGSPFKWKNFCSTKYSKRWTGPEKLLGSCDRTKLYRITMSLSIESTVEHSIIKSLWLLHVFDWGGGGNGAQHIKLNDEQLKSQFKMGLGGCVMCQHWSHGVHGDCGMVRDDVNDELWLPMADTCIHVCWYKLVINEMLACGYGSLHKRHQKTLCVPGDHLFTDSDNILSTVHQSGGRRLNGADAMRTNRCAVLGTGPHKDKQQTLCLLITTDLCLHIIIFFSLVGWLGRSVGRPLYIFVNPFN